MPFRRSVPPTCAAWLAAGMLAPAAWGGPPQGAELRDASLALGYEIKSRCPDLMQADVQEPGAALVVLVVGPSGVPSQSSIKSSSGSDALDAQALSCVMKLRFLPAVRAGEGTAVASWQEIAWKWGRARTAPPIPTPAMTTATAVSTEVRVCRDESGKPHQDPLVTRSSGDAGRDAAAVAIARAGSASLSGCAQMSIRLEPK